MPALSLSKCLRETTMIMAFACAETEESHSADETCQVFCKLLSYAPRNTLPNYQLPLTTYSYLNASTGSKFAARLAG